MSASGHSLRLILLDQSAPGGHAINDLDHMDICLPGSDEGVEAEGLADLGAQASLFEELALETSDRLLAPIESPAGERPVARVQRDHAQPSQQNRAVVDGEAVNPEAKSPAQFVDQHGASMTPVYQPMLATPHPQPFTSEEWWFDLKWDGFRCLTYIDGERVQLRSRNGNDLAHRFPELRSIRASEPVVLDGEIVAMGEDGKPSFFLLGYEPPQLVVFDLLHRDRSLVSLPLEERWDQLNAVELFGPITRSQPTATEGEALFEVVKASGLEGVVAKRSGSKYLPGRRSPDWRKIVARSQLNAVVGGYLRGTRGSFGSLLLGLYEGDRLLVAGSAGSGLDNRSIAELWPVLQSLERPTSPFAEHADFMGEPVWVEPRLVARIEYREWTPVRRLRAPVFKGIVHDLDPADVTWANEAPDL